MKILIILNYYFPYISGVSEYARLLAEGLVAKGYQVTVLTSNHDNLSSYEKINGVYVVRAEIIGKISKGTISPEFIHLAGKMARLADVVNMHLPMIESGIISRKIPSNKLIVTYHCDIHLRRNILNNLIVHAMDKSNNQCLKKASYIMVQTKDYSQLSRVASRYENKFLEAATPIKNYERIEKCEARGTVIGFCGRLVEEKGLDVLIRAYEIVKKAYPDTRLQIGGEYQNVAGGSIYPSLLEMIQKENIEGITFLGKIPDKDMAEFYSGLDVFVLPSVNSLEAFGMVQVEAMYCGTPVVASDLPGVKTVVERTGMGLIAKKNNPDDLAEKIMAILKNKQNFVKPKSIIAGIYGTEACISVYQKAFDVLEHGRI